MEKRPVDIARRLGISTTTIRRYEELGLLPPVLRTKSGYRRYTDEHIAYFICIREMMNGFGLTEIAGILQLVRAKRVDDALWRAGKAQAVLRGNREICERFKQRFLHRERLAGGREEFTVDAVSKATGVPAPTIRYWDNVGLLSASRRGTNNYRVFEQLHIDEVLILQALKLFTLARGEPYSIGQLREERQALDLGNREKLRAMLARIERYLLASNKALVRSISALYRLCTQVEAGQYDGW